MWMMEIISKDKGVLRGNPSQTKIGNQRGNSLKYLGCWEAENGPVVIKRTCLLVSKNSIQYW